MKIVLHLFYCSVFLLICCSADESGKKEDPPVNVAQLYFGADLSYVNQILDHGGVYKEGGTAKDPYSIFKSHGTNLVRLRLWHTPAWTKEVYASEGTQLYNDIKDVEKSIAAAKANGMEVLLDFHYSDTWADPGKQYIPAAWQNIKAISVLRDSVYNYTLKTLQYLNAKSLMPELVQIGNETNCGLLFTQAPMQFPACNVCDGQWDNAGEVINAGIRAVREVAANSIVKTKILLHVADPKNVEWWFDNIKSQAAVTDFDMIGFSYYPLWHTSVPLEDMSKKISGFKSRFNKDVIILETAYPWSMQGGDSYNNQFGNQQPIAGYPFTPPGQHDFMVKLTKEVIEGGGSGLIYWEPAWITSNAKDLWGTGSSWENCTFFDFQGSTLKGIDYAKFDY